MSINELWSVLSHGALVQFDPDAKAEELGPEDYDNIINNAMLVEEYTRQVRNTSCPAARVTHLPEHSSLPAGLTCLKTTSGGKKSVTLTRRTFMATPLSRRGFGTSSKEH